MPAVPVPEERPTLLVPHPEPSIEKEMAKLPIGKWLGLDVNEPLEAPKEGHPIPAAGIETGNSSNNGTSVVRHDPGTCIETIAEPDSLGAVANDVTDMTREDRDIVIQTFHGWSMYTKEQSRIRLRRSLAVKQWTKALSFWQVCVM